MGSKKKKTRKFSAWFQKSNTPRIFYHEILKAKEKRAQKIARKRTTQK